MRELLSAAGGALLYSAAVLLWCRHQLLVASVRWSRSSARWRSRFAATRQRLLGRRAPPRRWRRGGHNRTPIDTEEKLCRLAVDRQDLGLRGLRVLFARVEGVLLGVSTVRAILLRRRELLAELEEARKKRRRIVVRRARELWGVDLTLVWLWGVVPVWLLGVVDYYGSRLLLLEPVVPTAAAVSARVAALFTEVGAPTALLSDNGGQFVSGDFAGVLRERGVRHRRIRPGHAWTNGRIERVFGSLKRVQRRYARLFVSPNHLRRFCGDFTRYYNGCRPHQALWGLTPNEVARGEVAAAPLGVLSLFDGQLLAHRFT